MGFRFRKSVKIAPGVRMNFGKKGVGMSFGTKGARVSVNSSGRSRATVGIPGTGLSYSTSLNGKKKRKTTKATPVQKAPKVKKPASPITKLLLGAFYILCCIYMLIYGIIQFAQSGWILVVLGLALGFFAVRYSRKQLWSVLEEHKKKNGESNDDCSDRN